MDPVTLGLCSQIDLDFEVNRAAKERAEDRGAIAARPWCRPKSPRPGPRRPASQLEVFGASDAPKPKREEKIDVNSVFGKLKELKRAE